MLSLRESAEADLRRRATVLAGAPVRALVPLTGGANNRVFRLDAGSTRYALKLYPETPRDARDRLGAESAALRFLGDQGLRGVPRFVASDPQARLALHQWIDGVPVDVPGDLDIAAAAGLLRSLHGLRHAPAAAGLSLASEACLSAAELVAQIERRLARLREVAAAAPMLRGLLDDIAAALEKARERVAQRYREAGADFETPITMAQRSLSPSDFGFHNALRAADGSVVFHDFEYFGWDDPVKPVADFVLHPGMSVSDAQRRRFVADAKAIYGGDADYAGRLDALFPLFALRWTLILLNEFLPERWARRVQAGMAADRDAVQERQAAKAHVMLATAVASTKKFPYGD